MAHPDGGTDSVGHSSMTGTQFSSLIISSGLQIICITMFTMLEFAQCICTESGYDRN